MVLPYFWNNCLSVGLFEHSDFSLNYFIIWLSNKIILYRNNFIKISTTNQLRQSYPLLHAKSYSILFQMKCSQVYDTCEQRESFQFVLAHLIAIYSLRLYNFHRPVKFSEIFDSIRWLPVPLETSATRRAHRR